MLAPVVYLSGPIRDKDIIRIAEHQHRFRLAEHRLLVAGFAVINPAKDWDICGMGQLSIDLLLRKDEAILKKCDALYLLIGWETSTGALQENAWAREVRIPVVQEEVGGIEELKHIFGMDEPWFDGEPDD